MRLLTSADLAFADSVRALAGWNQTPADWQRFLAHEPEGCFLAEWDGVPAGTATTTTYGLDLAWIGMVLVHPDYRRRGLGKALLERCLGSLRERGIRCVKLDATPLGKTVYDNLGFKDEWGLTRWANPSYGPDPARSIPGFLSLPMNPHPDPLPSDGRGRVFGRLAGKAAAAHGFKARAVVGEVLSPIGGEGRSEGTGLSDALASLDAAAFGASRARLVQALVPQSCAALVAESEPGRLAGYGLVRPGARAFYLGPVVATSAETGLALIEALLASCAGQPVFWDIPDQNEPAVQWAREHGFSAQRPLMRMFLRENLAPGNPLRQFALSGPETG
ncbi:MAG: GNAT family N-acetyltransferase [Verrucomicrobia bacterium]|nr:GNAT family N-acetyltransferase [Verrucomicrobiota bacterium]